MCWNNTEALFESLLLFIVNTSDASKAHFLQLHSCDDEAWDFGQAAGTGEVRPYSCKSHIGKSIQT